MLLSPICALARFDGCYHNCVQQNLHIMLLAWYRTNFLDEFNNRSVFLRMCTDFTYFWCWDKGDQVVGKRTYYYNQCKYSHHVCILFSSVCHGATHSLSDLWNMTWKVFGYWLCVFNLFGGIINSSNATSFRTVARRDFRKHIYVILPLITFLRGSFKLSKFIALGTRMEI